MKALERLQKARQENELPERINPEIKGYQLEVIKNRAGVPVRKGDPIQIKTEMVLIFRMALRLSGQTKDESDETQVTSAVEALVRCFMIGEFGNITLEEIKVAIQSGVNGRYGEFFGINFKTLSQFIKGYINEANEVITKQRIFEGRLKREAEEKATSERLKQEFEESFEGLIKKDQEAKRLNPEAKVEDLGSVKCKRLIKEGKITLDGLTTNEFKKLTLKAYDQHIIEERKAHKRKHAEFGNDRIITQYRPPKGEDEKAKKNRIFFELVYNEWLKGYE